MKIAINATCFNENPSGAKKRFINIYKKIFLKLHNSEFVIFEPRDCEIKNWFGNFKNVKYIKTNLLSTNSIQRYFYGLFYWQKILKNINYDILEWFHLPLIKLEKEKTLLTIHDVRYNKFPHLYSLPRRLAANRVLLNSLNNANTIITVSQSIKNELLKYDSKKKIQVIYNGLENNFYYPSTSEEIEKVKIKYNINHNFVLTVGSLEKRKNLPILLKSIGLLNSIGININLIIVGGFYNDYKNIIDTAKLSNITKKIKILNNVTDNELKCLYQIADLFVFPSLYEGFGIPLIEAMSLNCPVLASNILPFKEIGQKNINYFNPLSVESLINQLFFLNQNLKILKQQIADAKKRSMIFNYDKIADSIIDNYNKINKTV